MTTRAAARREESGAVAVIVGLLSVVLLGCAGLTVDLGSMFVAHQQVQRVTDRAVLAGGFGQDLPAPAPTGSCAYGARAAATDQAVRDVAAYLSQQGTPVSAGQLVDCATANGELFYGTVAPSTTNSTGVQLSVNRNQLSLMSPPTRVGFGFAQVLGYDHADVSAAATAEVRSPMAGVPFYAYTGCDYGRQTISQPNNGHAADTLLLASPSDTNAAVLDPTRPALPLAPASPPALTLTGTNLGNVTAVGFFESGTSSAGPAPVVASPSQPPTATSVTVAVPPTVTGVEDYWYVRVKIGTSWSPVYTKSGALAAVPLVVGNPPLTCGQGSSQGNFGTLELDNPEISSNNQVDLVAMNIAGGVTVGLSVFPTAGRTSTGTCDGSTGTTAGDGTDCVTTEPGMAAQAAQKGFLDGVYGAHGYVGGRLTQVGDGSGCGTGGKPATTVFGSRTINNDTLSCFFTDDTTNVGQVSGSTYTLGHPVISAAIFRSPRFFMVPVLGAQPSKGGSQGYQIVDFRPAFLTDEADSATRTTAPTSTNGITGVGGSITSLQVVFLNPAALPSVEGVPTTAYAGAGPKALQLVN